MTYENIPDPNQLYPLPGHKRVMFIKNAALPDNVTIGDYTYYDDPRGIEAFKANILYHFDFTGDRLVIGKFCALATNTKFIMNGGNHRTDGLSTYPFMIFSGDWAGRFPEEQDFPIKGDTIVGHDVWLGYNATVMPGITIGDGAIVASESVVSSNVPPYAIVGGNPAKIIRMRYADDVIDRLLKIRWWDWDIQKITRYLPLISRPASDGMEVVKQLEDALEDVAANSSASLTAPSADIGGFFTRSAWRNE